MYHTLNLISFCVRVSGLCTTHAGMHTGTHAPISQTRVRVCVSLWVSSTARAVFLFQRALLTLLYCWCWHKFPPSLFFFFLHTCHIYIHTYMPANSTSQRYCCGTLHTHTCVIACACVVALDSRCNGVVLYRGVCPSISVWLAFFFPFPFSFFFFFVVVVVVVSRARFCART